MATARGKAELSDIAADHAREDYDIAKHTAKQFAPDFVQPGVFRTWFFFFFFCTKHTSQYCFVHLPAQLRIEYYYHNTGVIVVDRPSVIIKQ